MNYSISDVKKTLTPEKNKGDSLWVQYVARKCSFPLTVLVLNLGLSAWTVSVISVIIALVGCLGLCVDDPVVRTISIICVEFWMILDCTDGNVARVRKTTGPCGEFIDAVSGYVISGFLYFGIGMSAYYTSRFFIKNKYLWLIMGAIASITNILPRLIHQKYLVSMLNSGMIEKGKMNSLEEKKDTFQSVRKRIGKEFGLSGILMPALIIALFINIYDYICIFYTLFSVGAFCITILIYSLKTKN